MKNQQACIHIVLFYRIILAFSYFTIWHMLLEHFIVVLLVFTSSVQVHMGLSEMICHLSNVFQYALIIEFTVDIKTRLYCCKTSGWKSCTNILLSVLSWTTVIRKTECNTPENFTTTIKWKNKSVIRNQFICRNELQYSQYMASTAGHTNITGWTEKLYFHHINKLSTFQLVFTFVN